MESSLHMAKLNRGGGANLLRGCTSRAKDLSDWRRARNMVRTGQRGGIRYRESTHQHRTAMHGMACRGAAAKELHNIVLMLTLALPLAKLL